MKSQYIEFDFQLTLMLWRKERLRIRARRRLGAPSFEDAVDPCALRGDERPLR